ncbi:transcriptional regulator, MarR family [Methylobacterium sp. 4-46]|nr:transcriptional regulator, MarR family [Methylobacterium sp. 4-46]
MNEDTPADFTQDGDYLRGLMRALWILDTFRGMNPRMSITYAMGFLMVANRPGLGPTDYAPMLGTTQPIMSRMLLDLGPKTRDKPEGLGLLERRVSPESLRQVCYTLTAKGEELATKIARIALGPSGYPG